MKGFRRSIDVKNIVLLVIIAVLIVIIGVLVYLYYFGNSNGFLNRKSGSPTPVATDNTVPEPTAIPEPTPNPVNKTGNTIEERFPVPEGYERVKLIEGSFAEYLRKFPLKEYGIPAYTYEGKKNEDADVIGVFSQEITPKNLQQCADALMRLWAEYLFARGEFDKISFDFLTTPAFKCDFNSWATGKQIKIVNNKQAIWVDPEEPQEDYSYENFRKYLDMVHSYANTASLQNQMNNVILDQLAVGDVFIMTEKQLGKDYGHAAIIVDMAVNKETGEKIFIVAEGNMPATETYVVMNDDVLMGAWHKLNSSNSFVKKDWVCNPQYFRRFE